MRRILPVFIMLLCASLPALAQSAFPRVDTVSTIKDIIGVREFHEPRQRSYLRLEIRADQTWTLVEAQNPADTVPPPAPVSTRSAPPVMDMVRIPAKTFPLFDQFPGDRPPQMWQSVDSFLISRFEVSQAWFERVMGYNGSRFSGADLPKDQASWYEAIIFCNLLSIQEGLDPVYLLHGSSNPDDWGDPPQDDGQGGHEPDSGDYKVWDTVICQWNKNGYRLPTDMEWRAAAMGNHNGPTFGPAGVLYKFAGDPNPGLKTDRSAEFGWNNDSGTHPVGQKLPNDYGLYDLSGNVWEWVWDWASGRGYYLGDEKNYRGPDKGNGDKIRHGGSWTSDPYFAANGGHRPWSQEGDAGFRVARSF